MNKKSFKIARKPGQGDRSQVLLPEPEKKSRKHRIAPPTITSASGGLTTRKTIEVPEDYFRQVKIRAVERDMLEKELWAEILGEYFKNHPAV
jgi:hypothetical protein